MQQLRGRLGMKRRTEDLASTMSIIRYKEEDMEWIYNGKKIST